jgi:hypothetical protein
VRRLAVLTGLGLVLGAVALPVATRSQASASRPFQLGQLSADAAFRDGTLHAARPLRDLRQSSWGGPTIAADGETVNVLVSDAYPVDPAIPQATADLMAQLYHGSELSTVSIYLAPLAEVQSICGAGTGGCYARDQIVATGDALPDGTSAANVIVHEYGHYVADNSVNSPWDALDWGPKRWDTSAGICARVAAGTAFPGDEGTKYQLNPGEAWAETYRLLNYRKQTWPNWILTDWRVVDRSFYPNAAELTAAKTDVLQPWVGPQRRTWTGRFRRVAPKGKPIRVPLVLTVVSTPLDGDVTVALQRAPAGTTMWLSTPAGKVVLPATHHVLSTTVCGRRRLVLTVRSKKPGAFAFSISTP